VTYCNVQGGWPGDGNIDTDPLFAFRHDFHLMPDSPCIDAGTNDPTGGLPVTDQDGNGRPLDGNGDTVAVSDMGAYEFNTASPSIALSQTVFEFFALQGGDDPADQTLLMRNCGGGTLNWEISEQQTWLAVTPGSGQSNGEVDRLVFSVDSGDLPNGVYTGALEVSDPQAVNSPRRVIIGLYVTRTLKVPSEYPTIQAAIDAAVVRGDVVLISDGIYTGEGNKNLECDGKAITIRSASGDSALCIVDCQGVGCGFVFDSGEGRETIVEALTVMNGTGYDPGDGRTRGGGVYCDSSSPTLTKCRITGNSARLGGGICCWFSAPTLTDCTINQNSTESSGGGVYCFVSSPTLTNCTISGNSGEYGGGTFCSSSNPTFTNCTISGNYGGYGGGVYCMEGNPTLTGCAIILNSATFAGGGVCCEWDGRPRLTHCTITQNAAGYGGGVFCRDFLSRATLINCILWSDVPDEINARPGNVLYCDVQGGFVGWGNIDADPLFVDPDGPDDDPNTWEDNDYRLSPGSPCIDAGDNRAVPLDVADLDGDGYTDERIPLP
jgi:hypothetical protein